MFLSWFFIWSLLHFCIKSLITNPSFPPPRSSPSLVYWNSFTPTPLSSPAVPSQSTTTNLGTKMSTLYGRSTKSLTRFVSWWERTCPASRLSTCREKSWVSWEDFWIIWIIILLYFILWFHWLYHFSNFLKLSLQISSSFLSPVGGLSTTDIKRVFVGDRVDLSILDKYIVEFKRDSFKEDKKVVSVSVFPKLFSRASPTDNSLFLFFSMSWLCIHPFFFLFL